MHYEAIADLKVTGRPATANHFVITILTTIVVYNAMYVRSILIIIVCSQAYCV